MVMIYNNDNNNLFSSNFLRNCILLYYVPPNPPEQEYVNFLSSFLTISWNLDWYVSGFEKPIIWNIAGSAFGDSFGKVHNDNEKLSKFIDSSFDKKVLSFPYSSVDQLFIVEVAPSETIR